MYHGIQSANQPNVECKLSFWSTIFKGMRSNLTYKLTINGETTRISVPKKLSKREAVLDPQPAEFSELSISTKEIFANTTDIKTINKNFKLATLSSIASKDDITGYDEIIKSACKGLQTEELGAFFAKQIKDAHNKQSNGAPERMAKNIFSLIEKTQNKSVAVSFLTNFLKKDSGINDTIWNIWGEHQNNTFWSDAAAGLF